MNKIRSHRSMKALRHHRREGMTLVEIMIVVIIMALIATAVGVAVVPKMQQARVTQTETDAQTVAAAASSYILTDPSAGCPTMDDLVETGELSRNTRTVDAWDQQFDINCDDAEPVVTSAGPDQQLGTEDDIRTGG